MSGRWPRQILFGDIDAMFASAAVLADPSLAAKPVAVGGPPPRGIVAAASYEVSLRGAIGDADHSGHAALPSAHSGTA